MSEQLRLDGRTITDLIADGQQLVADLQREHKPVGSKNEPSASACVTTG